MIRARHARARAQPTARINARRTRALVSAGRAPAGGAEVWLVRFDPRVVTVAVTGGPNKGRTVPHRNLVREMVKLGDWEGRARTYPLPQPEAETGGLRAAVLVQAVRDREILAAAVEG